MNTPRWLRSSVATVCLLALMPSEADAQFNPRGRSRTKPPATAVKPRPSKATPKTEAPTPRADSPTANTPSANAPTTDALIARYTAIVLAQPGAQFPLARLAELYRQRDGNVDKLIEFLTEKSRAAGGVRDLASYSALVALGGIYQVDGHPDLAISTYERAIAEQPNNPTALLALAEVQRARGDKSGARTTFDRALPLLKDAAAIEQTLRTLLELALDLKDLLAAKQIHGKLVTRAQGSFFVRRELGRELMLRGHHKEAEAEYREVVKAAAGDNRVLAPALRDLGGALHKLGKKTEALTSLKRALTLAGNQAGIRREIFELMIAVYRDNERLPELVALLEKEQTADFERLRMLGGLYEEVGRVDDAVKTYRLALTRDAKAIDVRLRTVQLMQLQGDLEGAILEYRKLTRAAPRNPEFVFQLAEALLQRGSRQEALKELTELERRSARDEETLTLVVDFYERIGEPALATKVLEQLASGGSREPRHFVELGDRQFQTGDVKRAKQTWQRLLVTIPNRAAALLALGEVYLEHDLPDEALKLLKQALDLEPKLLVYKRAYAMALERTGASAASKSAQHAQYLEAAKLWEQLLKDARQDQNLVREARQHVVTLWSMTGQLKKRLLPLERQFRSTPPDLDAGKLLAEALLRLHRYTEAEAMLRAIVSVAPGDVASLQSLENVLVRGRRLADAILILKKLVQAEPKRAREYYQRMARYSAELYEDDAALLYAARAVDLSPDDAEGHKKLGEMYRQRQELDKAISAFRQAILKNDRLFLVYFQLAELLIGKGQIEEADQLLRRVFRSAPDEELVTRAVRTSVQLNLGRGTLATLEKELLPLALGNPDKPLYRRLLLEVYGTLAFPLMQAQKSGSNEAAADARAELKRIGERAVKPLLDALSDPESDQQQTAIELLTHIENRGAGPSLLAHASGNADPLLRTRAVIAAGALSDKTLLPRLKALLFSGVEQGPSESDPVSLAAAWAISKMNAPEARPVLREMLGSSAPSISALGVLGLGALGDKASIPRFRTLAATVEAGPLPRAAAAFVLGQFADVRSIALLARLSESTDPIAREAAIMALARLKAPAAERAIARSLLSPEPSVRDMGAAAALVYASGEFREARVSRTPDTQIDVRALLEQKRPSGYTAEQHLSALEKLVPALTSVAMVSVQISPEAARAVANTLLVRGGELGFRPLELREDSEQGAAHSTREWRRKVSETIEPLAKAVVEPFRSLTSHPLASVRGMALQFLALRPEPLATQALLDALKDPDENVQRAALEALSSTPRPNGKESIVDLLAHSPDWALRARAARGLGKLSRATGDEMSVRALIRTADRDHYALVREAALRALVEVDPVRARQVLTDRQKRDPEPRLRNATQELLRTLSVEQAAKANTPGLPERSAPPSPP